ncbi:MAG: hypothetical protein ACXWN4_00115 [Candidatus Limnocylindrales bacterium]
MRGWWASKIKRTRAYLRAGVPPAERVELAAWLQPTQLELFDRMLVSDRRHGLDVVEFLRQHGVVEGDLLIAGLLHDCGKGTRVRLVHRVAWSLGQRYGAWIWRASAHLPTFGEGLVTLRNHAARSAELAAEAGCSPRTVELIRNQEAPTDEDGRLLLAADEAN